MQQATENSGQEFIPQQREINILYDLLCEIINPSQKDSGVATGQLHQCATLSHLKLGYVTAKDFITADLKPELTGLATDLSTIFNIGQLLLINYVAKAKISVSVLFSGPN